MRRVGGFSLLEVLVALAVLAVALLALVRAVSQSTAVAERLNERTLALIVAQNLVAEVRLREPWPALGLRDGRSEMGRLRFAWRVGVSDTPQPELRRIDVQVFRDVPGGEAEPVLTLSGFAGRR